MSNKMLELEIKKKQEQQEKQEILNKLLNDYALFVKLEKEEGKQIILDAIKYLLS